MRRFTLTERADLAVFYEAEAAHWRATRPRVVEVVTQDAFIEFYRNAPSIGFACEGRPIGGILFDGLRAHIAVLPQYHGLWALLMKPALRWLFALQPAVLADVAADNHKCLRFLDRHGFRRLATGPRAVTYLLEPRGGTRKTAYPVSRPARARA